MVYALIMLPGIRLHGDVKHEYHYVIIKKIKIFRLQNMRLLAILTKLLLIKKMFSYKI